MIYLSNAFSLQMISTFPANIKIQEVASIPTDAYSVVGHEDTARILGVKFNRENLILKEDDVLYVAQLVGGRLPEGATKLPDGFKFKFLKVDFM